MTPLSYAVEFGCEEIVKYLLTQNVDLSTVNESGHTVLHLACMRGKHDIVAAIAEKADINAKDQNRMTPFSVACRYGKVGAMQVLIDKGIDINYEVFCVCVSVVYAMQNKNKNKKKKQKK